MHFEILVEDQSGKKALDILVPNILPSGHTIKVISYKGVGRIPKDLTSGTDPAKRILLDQLPKLLNGYGKTFSKYPQDYRVTVIIVCDLDTKNLEPFVEELISLLQSCTVKPDAHFCIAIEEGEAWLLGDIPAIQKAYPKAKSALLNSYKNDSICGTWEYLADAIFPGGSQALIKAGWQATGAEKSEWAGNISPHMKVDENKSPSFQNFRDKLRSLAELSKIK